MAAAFSGIKSLAHDKDVERSFTKLDRYMRLLTFSQSTSSLDSINKLPNLESLRLSNNTASRQPLKPVFMVPFGQDDTTFVGREEILKLVDQNLNSPQRRAVLTGLGGVG